MNSDVKTDTAKIYQFPQRAPKTPPKEPAPITKIVCDSCWYHDEAIRESEHMPIKPGR